MAPIGRHNIAKMTSLTTGTGTLTLFAAAPGYNTFADAGVTNGEVVTYTIRDGGNTEVGRGTYTSSGTTLSRDTVLSSTNGGSKIDCTGREYVMVSLAAEDIQPFASYYGSISSVSDSVDDQVIGPSTEWVDPSGIASISSNEVTITKKGWYWLSVVVDMSSGTAFNGRVEIQFGNLYKQEGYTTSMGITYDYAYVGPLLYNVPSDNTNLGSVTFSNHAGSTIDASVIDLTIFKIGNQ